MTTNENPVKCLDEKSVKDDRFVKGGSGMLLLPQNTKHVCKPPDIATHGRYLEYPEYTVFMCLECHRMWKLTLHGGYRYRRGGYSPMYYKWTRLRWYWNTYRWVRAHKAFRS